MLLPKCNGSTNSKQKRKQTPSLRSTDWKSALKLNEHLHFSIERKNKVTSIHFLKNSSSRLFSLGWKGGVHKFNEY